MVAALPGDALPASPGQARLIDAYGRLPVYFAENRGRFPAAVKYYAQGVGYSALITDDGITIVPVPAAPRSGAGDAQDQPQPITLRAVGARTDATVRAEGGTEAAANYFIGNDPRRWQTHVPMYRSLVYRDLYPGIDLRVYGDQRRLEYDLIVHPGADPRRVRLACNGARALTLADNGDLMLDAGDVTLIQRRPFIYQVAAQRRVPVDGRFVIAAGTADQAAVEFGFEVGEHDTTQPLIIDPVIEYSSYLGGSRYDVAFAVTVDASGSAYIVGSTYAPDYPAVNAAQPKYSGPKFVVDAFVTKVLPDGSGLVYSTFLGGFGDGSGDKTRSGIDEARAVAVDPSGYAYVAGTTRSEDFPVTKDALQKRFNQGECSEVGACTDAFVVKLDPSGSKFVYSSFLGGRGDDSGWGIAADTKGFAYVVGDTNSVDFQTTAKAMKKDLGGSACAPASCVDGFVTKLAPDGRALAYSTLIGGAGYDNARAIVLGVGGEAYVTGGTVSSDFPTKAPIQAKNRGSGDAFVLQLDPSGGQLGFATYLGGSGGDVGVAIALDGSGNVYVAGDTQSSDFPTTPGAFATAVAGDFDAFVASVSPRGDRLNYAGYIGGSGREAATGIAVDTHGTAYIVGATMSANFPLVEALQTERGGLDDAFIARVASDGGNLLFSSYFGGAVSDRFAGVAEDGQGGVYVAGFSSSLDMPTVKPYQDHHRGGGDAMMAKFMFEPPKRWWEFWK